MQSNHAVKRNSITHSVWMLCGLVLIASPTGAAHACGACYRLPYQSLLEKVEGCDRVVVAYPAGPTEATWKVDQVIKGRDAVGDELRNVGDSAVRVQGRHILRWNEILNSWTVERPFDRDLVAFLKGAVQLPTTKTPMSARQQAERLRYFLPYLEHPDARIADSTHAKLARAPYAVLRELAADLDRNRLVTWITAQRTAAKQRGALYLILLGHCADEETSGLLQQWIDQRWAGSNGGYLAALLTAHVEVNGEEAVQFIEASYLQDRDRSLGEIVAAVDALRTHGESETRISRERIKSSFHLLLRERPPLAELVVDDFLRWKDWSIAPQLMQIHASGKQPWNNALIIKYLRACPLPCPVSGG